MPRSPLGVAALLPTSPEALARLGLGARLLCPLPTTARRCRPWTYAVRCTSSSQVWVGRTPNLPAVPNRLWFTLRQGGHQSRSLQPEWERHGAESFAFEELERLEEEPIAYILDKRLKERAEHWRDRLDAKAI